MEVVNIYLIPLRSHLLTPHYKYSEPVNQTCNFHLHRLLGHLRGRLAVDIIFLKEKNSNVLVYTNLKTNLNENKNSTLLY